MLCGYTARRWIRWIQWRCQSHPIPSGGRPLAWAARPTLSALSTLFTLFTALILSLVLVLVGCEASLQQALDDAAGRPAASDSTGTEGRAGVALPDGPLLACLTNVGHTLFAFDLSALAALPETQVVVDLEEQ